MANKKPRLTLGVMATIKRLIPILVIIVSIIIHTSYYAEGASDSECREYDEVHYSKTDEYALSRINLQKIAPDTKLPSAALGISKEFSPQGTRYFIMKSPDFMKDSPWNTDIYVRGNLANPVKLKISFLDHGNGGVRAKWLNEKLLFVQVWWGRIVSTDLILDVDSASWVYSQNAN